MERSAMKIKSSSLNKKERHLFEEAQQMLADGTDALEFSSHFFGHHGALSGLGSDRKARRKLTESELYKWLQHQVGLLRKQEAASFEKELEAASGRLTITIPKSLHVALKQEARNEGISLSELIRLKLGFSYRQVIAESLARYKKQIAIGD